MNNVFVKRYMFLVITGFVLVVYSIFFILDEKKIKYLTYEDGIIESFGAIMFLLSSIFLGILYLYSHRIKTSKLYLSGFLKKNIFLLLLSLFFLLCFLEEISWGQRIFGIETPEAIAQINRQKETNIHNLRWFHGLDESGHRKSFLKLLINGDRLFSMFWFSYCVCIPLLGTYNKKIKAFLAKIRFPVIPLSYAFLFPLNYVIPKVIEEIYPLYRHNIVETKESVFAFLFACVAFGQIVCLYKKKEKIRDVSSF